MTICKIIFNHAKLHELYSFICIPGVPAGYYADQTDASPRKEVPEPAEQNSSTRATVRLPGQRV